MERGMTATALPHNHNGTWQLENPLVSVTINPERGADIISFVWKRSGEEILWRNPRAEGIPPRRGDYDLADSSYFDNYPGGIQEIFPNAGSATEVGGAALPFHGEALRRAWATESDGATLTCTTLLTRYPFKMTKVFWLDDEAGVLHFSSLIENLAESTLPVHWGLHPAFNTKSVAAGGRVYGAFSSFTSHPDKFGAAQCHAPGTSVEVVTITEDVRAFELSPASSRTADLTYATVSQGWFGLRSPGTDLLATMTWPHEIFPELWIWQECHAPGEYPWWGTQHIVGVEPQSTSPLSPLADEAGAMTVAGGQSLKADFTLGVQPITTDQIPTGMGSNGVAVVGRGGEHE
jgi:galactose mutarotase-like enzyme